MNGDAFWKRSGRSAILVVSLCLLTSIFLAGTVSASGSGGGSGGSSEITYASTTLFSNWALVSGDYYETIMKNPSSCVSKVTVVLPKKPSSVDYLSYAIGKYSDQLTTRQKLALIDPLGMSDPETGEVTRTTLLNSRSLPADSLEDFSQLNGVYANTPGVTSSTPVTGWVLDDEGAE